MVLVSAILVGMELREIRKSRNFRELGGYLTEDGRKIRNGCFYRSGALGDLNHAELRAVRKAGIRHVFDLRSQMERDMLKDPDIPGAKLHELCAFTDENGNEADMSPKGLAQASQADAGLAVMKYLYSNLPFHSASYRQFFEVMRKQEVPILFHCTAGKDRTGVLAMLVLILLGCDEETALRDYMKTNEYRGDRLKKLLDEYQLLIRDDPQVGEMLRLFEGVEIEYARLSLDAVKQRYGTYAAYFEAEYGLAEAEIRRLREIYTVPAEDRKEGDSE